MTRCKLNIPAVDRLFQHLHRTKCRSVATYDVLPVEYDMKPDLMVPSYDAATRDNLVRT